MKSSGLADSPFFEKKPQASASILQPPKTADKEGADSATGPETVATSGRDAGKTGDQEHGVQVDQPAGTTEQRHDGMTADYPNALVEALRCSVKELGKERSEHRLTVIEKEAVVDIVYQFKRQSIRTTENEVARIAINFIIADYREHGDKSVLVRVLRALNA